MKIVARYAIALCVTYFVAWTVSYLIIFLTRGDGLNLPHYFEYLVLAWTFRAGELPFFIWLFSILGFLPLAILVVFLLHKFEKQKDHVG